MRPRLRWARCSDSRGQPAALKLGKNPSPEKGTEEGSREGGRRDPVPKESRRSIEGVRSALERKFT